MTPRAVRALWLSALALAAPGCSVSMSDASAFVSPANQCERNADCPGGQCVGGVCVASTGQFGTVLFEVTPPADATFAGVRFLKRLDGLAPNGGSRDIQLDHVARVVGRVTSAATDCPPFEFYDASSGLQLLPALDGSLPVRVVVTPSARVLGIPTVTYAADALPPADVDPAQQQPSLPFALNLPPGEYDIYIQTFGQEGLAPGQGRCAVPPQLYRRQRIESGEVQLNLELAEASRLELTVELPVGARSLSDWTADMLDPISGRVISDRVKLGMPTAAGERLEYKVGLSYSLVIDDAQDQALELVRLSPPEGEVAPSILMERWVLDFNADGLATIDQLTTLPSDLVEVEGQVQATSGAAPSGTTVTLIAEELAGVSGVSASFARTVEAVVPEARPNDPPKFSVVLLPGKYRVHAVPPPESGLAAMQTTWEVSSSPSYQAGRVIELAPTASLVGYAVDPTGSSPVTGAAVHAVSSSSTALVSARDRAVWGISPFVPRASTGVVDASGAFEFSADPGVFDFSVRPPESSGFSWLVRPDLRVTSASQDLGRMTLPLPIVYQGSVTIPGAASNAENAEPLSVPNALIRAYVYLDQNRAYTAQPDDPLNPARFALQVAETRADDEGRFRLLLPSRLH